MEALELRSAGCTAVRSFAAQVRELDQAYEYLLSERAHTAAAHSSAHADVASALAKALPAVL